MIPDYEFRKGDTEPIFAQRLTWSDGSPVDLTGAALALTMRSLGDPAPVAITGAVTSPTLGQIQYKPSTADTTNLEPGPYLGTWDVVFSDGTPQSFPTDGFLLINVEENLHGTLTIGVRPSVAEVAALLRARTKVSGGKEAGTFNQFTRPTGDEVDALIDDAEDEVLGKVQPIDPSLPPGSGFNAPGSKYERRIRGAIKQYAAILVELSYFPEQVANSQSPAPIYQELYKSRIEALIAEGETGTPQGEGSGGTGGSDSPADSFWAFPNTGPGALVGWGSRW